MFYQILLVMTGYQDYLIVLSPPDGIINQVKQLKQYCYDRIGEYDSLYSKAHITVQYLPRKRPMWIDPLIPKLERELQALPSAVLDINGFNFFDHAENPTIYANINQTPLTRIWFKHLKRHFGLNSFEPSITITRSIPNKSFNKLWPYFKNLKWNEQFKVDRLTILRRETIGHDRSYKPFKEIPFNHRLDFNTFANSKIKIPALTERVVNLSQISLF